MDNAKRLGYGYLYSYNEYTDLWECASHRDAVHLYGTGTDRSKYVSTGKTVDRAALNYIKKFKK